MFCNESDWAFWEGFDAYYAYEHRTYDNPFDSWHEPADYLAWTSGWDAARRDESDAGAYGHVYYW